MRINHICVFIYIFVLKLHVSFKTFTSLKVKMEKMHILKRMEILIIQFGKNVLKQMNLGKELHTFTGQVTSKICAKSTNYITTTL